MTPINFAQPEAKRQGNATDGILCPQEEERGYRGANGEYPVQCFIAVLAFCFANLFPYHLLLSFIEAKIINGNE